MRCDESDTFLTEGEPPQATWWQMRGNCLVSISVHETDYGDLGWSGVIEKLLPYEVALPVPNLYHAYNWSFENASNWYTACTGCLRFRSPVDAVTVKLLFSGKDYENN